jgi:hypothetical protein
LWYKSNEFEETYYQYSQQLFPAHRGELTYLTHLVGTSKVDEREANVIKIKRIQELPCGDEPGTSGM